MEDDDEIQQSILEELNWEPALDGHHIAVEVRDGIVTLSGWVHYLIEITAAEEAVKRVKGVKGVAHKIEIISYNA